ncbi:hypothetical protein [Rossellomorea aquimaris]|uniref:DUF3951 domain-containing protein n=1 Tax=Rossellomorea aquimaris TaxID=189382 RepID=A0A366EQ69_9BACI|nr:hypothetical protein [Rossellomorea aquimaris]RBP04444.1 hypothetical protein DET59_106236 [Rossellomorea aquimaris]
MEIINSVQEVLSSGLAFVVYIAIPAFIIIKAIRRKKLPNNHYTPVDDILDGKVKGLEEDSDRTDNS